MTTDWSTETKGVGQYADVDGLHLYYETFGSGKPLILLHGGLGSGEMFGPVPPALAESRQVIAPDLQGHGRTADIDRPLDVRLMVPTTSPL
jgi:pimeloyl-ACP methyl ester carboxylesterase